MQPGVFHQMDVFPSLSKLIILLKFLCINNVVSSLNPFILEKASTYSGLCLCGSWTTHANVKTFLLSFFFPSFYWRGIFYPLGVTYLCKKPYWKQKFNYLKKKQIYTFFQKKKYIYIYIYIHYQGIWWFVWIEREKRGSG